MKNTLTILAAALAALAIAPAHAQVTAPNPFKQGYVVDGSGNFVINSTGLCWHTAQWTPALAVEPCDPTIKAVAAPAPAPVIAQAVRPEPAQAPAPAAVVKAPMAAPVAMPQKISFSGDALFAFDKAALQPEGRTLLDGLVKQLAGATYDNLLVTGHTDRIGSDRYNQKLSEQRAQTVKDYLVNQNIQAARINAMGKGETQPVTKAGDCTGAKSTKLIACLQPDRRVDIEMKGTKPNF